MSDDAINSGRASDRTSPGEQRLDPASRPDVSEADFLGEEAQRAKAAVVRSLREIQEDLKAAVDIREWAREHPWMAVGIASLAGFAAAAASRPAEDAPEPSADGQAEPASTVSGKQASAARSETWHALGAALGWLAVPLADLVKTAVEKFISSVKPATDPGARPPQPADPLPPS